jgi:hypothetical protein
VDNPLQFPDPSNFLSYDDDKLYIKWSSLPRNIITRKSTLPFKPSAKPDRQGTEMRFCLGAKCCRTPLDATFVNLHTIGLMQINADINLSPFFSSSSSRVEIACKLYIPKDPVDVYASQKICVQHRVHDSND